MALGINLYDPVKIPIKRVCSIYYLRWWYNGWHYWAFLPGKYTVVTEGETYRTIGTRKIGMSSGQVTLNQAMAIRTVLNTREVYILTVDGWMNIRIEPGNPFVYNNITNGGEIEITAIIGSRELSYASGYSPISDIPVVPPDVTYCEVIIGTQIWMCENWDAKWPNSKVYNDDEANRVLYGGLYTFDQIHSPGFCPAGWHVPTYVEWLTLLDYIGGYAVAGGKLKEIGLTYWDAPNTGAVDTYGFSAKGGGFYMSGYGFAGLKTAGNFWTADEVTAENGRLMQMTNDAETVLAQSLPKSLYLSVRLLKDTPPPPISYNDWFLPSRYEWQKMLQELYLTRSNIANFSIANEYWTSSEESDTLAWSFYFPVASSHVALKSDTHYVRACRSFNSTTIYALGDVGPTGGWIFHIIDLGGGNYTYYECASIDQSVSQVWSNIINVAIGTTSYSIGEGQNNTNEIIAQAGHTDSAAKLCDDLVVTYP